VGPGPDVEGVAHFLAAIHNAHRHQSRRLVSHQLDRAVQSEKAVEVMRHFLETQAGGRRRG